MKIVFSRKGFDSKYGGIPSVVWPETKEMLSFPIPVKPPELGYPVENLSFMGKQLSGLLNSLDYNWERQGSHFHYDPMIQSLPERPQVGAFGQSGSALGHLKNQEIGKGDIFLFFGTFCECYFDHNQKLKYLPMHPFHAIWGFLEVDSHIDIESSQSDDEEKLFRQYPVLKKHSALKEHPHIQNRNRYKTQNTLYLGEKFGTFRFDESLRLTKMNFKKSIWELPAEFREAKITHVNHLAYQTGDSKAIMKTAHIGQEFVLSDPNDGIIEWLNSILNRKIV
jgi:Nucleotide modification associated domain 3